MSSVASLGILPKLNPSGRKASSESSKETMACFLNQMARTPDNPAEPLMENSFWVLLSIQANVSPVCACSRINSSRTDSVGDGRAVIASANTIHRTGPNRIQSQVTNLRFRIGLAALPNEVSSGNRLGSLTAD